MVVFNGHEKREHYGFTVKVIKMMREYFYFRMHYVSFHFAKSL